ncbi:MAG: hypothetical protein NTV67_01450, partial [Chloroflexi bacterium]|nr:hypothetical protein [Chloroflexota bacterium]
MISLLTTLTAALFAALLFNQYRFRRAPYQLACAIGATAFAAAAAAETLAGFIGWSEPLYRVWYLTGAVWTAGWLGTGTVLLLSKTRFGYWYSACLGLAGLFTILVARRLEDPAAGPTALVYALLAWSAAVSIAWLAYLGSTRWSGIAVGLVLLLSAVALPLVATAQLPAPGWAT